VIEATRRYEELLGKLEEYKAKVCERLPSYAEIISRELAVYEGNDFFEIGESDRANIASELISQSNKVKNYMVTLYPTRIVVSLNPREAYEAPDILILPIDVALQSDEGYRNLLTVTARAIEDNNKRLEELKSSPKYQG
jgi:hypothetical protein